MQAAHAAIRDHHGVRWLAAVVSLRRGALLHECEHLLAAHDLAEAHVLAGEARHICQREEELRRV